MNKLPLITSDLDQCKKDLDFFGYCLLDNALSLEQVKLARKRLIEQATAEREANLAFLDGAKNQKWGSFQGPDGKVDKKQFSAAEDRVSQRLFMLLNKGNIFCKIAALDNALALVGHVLGKDFLLSCATANIVGKNAAPMELHTDSWWMPPPVKKTASRLPVGSISREESGELKELTQIIVPPACINSMWMLVDFSAENGATRVVPGSHLSGRQPRPDMYSNQDIISIEAPAGTAMFFDGRLWHGSGTNQTNQPRMGLLNTYCGPQFRTQENYTAGTLPKVYKSLPIKLKELIGFKVWNGYGRFDMPAVHYIEQEQLIGELKLSK